MELGFSQCSGLLRSAHFHSFRAGAFPLVRCSTKEPMLRIRSSKAGAGLPISQERLDKLLWRNLIGLELATFRGRLRVIKNVDDDEKDRFVIVCHKRDAT